MEYKEISIIKEWDNYTCIYKKNNAVSLNVANILISAELFDKIRKSTLSDLNNILSDLFKNSHKYKKSA